MKHPAHALKTVVTAVVLGCNAGAQAASITTESTYRLPSIFWVDDGSNNEQARYVTHSFSLSNDRFDSALGVLTDAALTVRNRGLLTGESTSSGTGGESWLVLEDRTLGGYSSFFVSSVHTFGVQQRLGNVNTSDSLAVNGGLAQFLGTDSFQSNIDLTLVADKQAGGSGLFAGRVVSRLDARPYDVTRATAYTYLQHANASFAAGADSNSLDLDLGSGAAAFDIHALAGSLGAAETTTLDAVGLSCVSGCSDFALSPAALQDLVAGQSAPITASLTATAPGSYAAQYLWTFSDDLATGVGQQQNTLVLNLTATVAAVPEPGTWALMGAGLLGVCCLVQQQKKPARKG